MNKILWNSRIDTFNPSLEGCGEGSVSGESDTLPFQILVIFLIADLIQETNEEHTKKQNIIIYESDVLKCC